MNEDKMEMGKLSMQKNRCELRIRLSMHGVHSCTLVLVFLDGADFALGADARRSRTDGFVEDFSLLLDALVALVWMSLDGADLALGADARRSRTDGFVEDFSLPVDALVATASGLLSVSGLVSQQLHVPFL